MIIGISGRAKSGKDTAADFLVKNHGFIKIAFADELKRICTRCFPKMPEENLWGASELRNKPVSVYPRLHGPWVSDEQGTKRCACCNLSFDFFDDSPCYLTARYALQILGTEWGRDCYPLVWVDLTLDVADKLLHKSGILRSVHYHYTPQEGLVVSNVPVVPKPKGVVISDVRWPNGNEGQRITAAGGILWRMMRGQGLGGASGRHASERAMEDVPLEIFQAVIRNQEMELDQLEQYISVLAKTGFREYVEA